MPLSPRDYQDALDVQGACNLIAVVNSLSRVMQKIREEPGAGGTQALNTHPVVRLYAEQVAWLSGAGPTTDSASYARALEACQAGALPRPQDAGQAPAAPLAP
jgi:hypothetical protein